MLKPHIPNALWNSLNCKAVWVPPTSQNANMQHILCNSQNTFQSAKSPYGWVYKWLIVTHCQLQIFFGYNPWIGERFPNQSWSIHLLGEAKGPFWPLLYIFTRYCHFKEPQVPSLLIFFFSDFFWWMQIWLESINLKIPWLLKHFLPHRNDTTCPALLTN